MGKMSLEESDLLIAIEKSMLNAEEMISDADYLETDGRLPRAYALYQLAIEEIGKAMRIYSSIVLGLLTTEEQRKQFIKNFTDHVEKAQSARSLSLLVLEEAGKRDAQPGRQLMEMLVNEYGAAKSLNNYKNYSLYTSWVDDSYKTPKEAISQERVNFISLMARTRLAVAKVFFQGALTVIDEIKQRASEYPLTEEQQMELVTKWVGKLHTTLNPDPGE